MSKKLRYRLQKKVPIARPNILGNHSFPVHTYQWKDIAASDDREALVKVMPNDRDYRIEDTDPPTEEKKEEEGQYTQKRIYTIFWRKLKNSQVR